MFLLFIINVSNEAPRYLLSNFSLAAFINHHFREVVSAREECISTNPLSNNSTRSSSREIVRPVYAWSRSELFSSPSATRRTVAQPAAKPAAMSSSESPTCGMGTLVNGALYRDAQVLISACSIKRKVIRICDLRKCAPSFLSTPIARRTILQGPTSIGTGLFAESKKN